MIKVPLFVKVLPFYCLILTVLSLNGYSSYQHKISIQHASAIAESKLNEVSNRPNKIEGNPVRILIPDLNIDIEVYKGSYNQKDMTWAISNSGANYATNTPKINSLTGRSIIYGHMLPRIFANLRNATDNTVAYVYTDNNHIFKYKFASTEIVKPENTAVFNSLNGKPGIFLITCENWDSSERRVVHFNLVSVQ